MITKPKPVHNSSVKTLVTSILNEHLPGVLSHIAYDYFGGRPWTSTWLTKKLSLPLTESGSYEFVVDWGDGTMDCITKLSQPEATHVYETLEKHTIKIWGRCRGNSLLRSSGSTRYRTMGMSAHWKR